MEIVSLDARTDYRLEKLARAPVYYCPADAAADAAMDAAFVRLTGVARGAPLDVPRLGRAIHVPQAVGAVARFDFDALCRRPLSAGDYVALASRFETFFVDRIPVMRDEERDATKRFINFIDAAYDARVKLLASAEAEPEALAPTLTGDEAFEFARTASRLMEMRSRDYLGARAYQRTGRCGPRPRRDCRRVRVSCGKPRTTVIASEAKQSSAGAGRRRIITSTSVATPVGGPDPGASRRALDCFASLAMTVSGLKHLFCSVALARVRR